MNPYMYLFVRNDLSHCQQIVQTAHAVDEINKSFPHESGNYMVLCGADTEDELFEISNYLSVNGIVHHMFHESDLPGYTAIATEPLKGEQRIPLRRFKTKK